MPAPRHKPPADNQHRPISPAEIEALFKSIGQGIIVTDRNARVSHVNKAALDILGFAEKELLGKWFPETIVAENQEGEVLPSLDRPIAQAFLTGQNVSARVYYRRKNGTKVALQITVAPVMVAGKPVGAIEVFRDIGRDLALEQAKDEFMAIASHQLRTPATAVRQYLGLLLEGYAGELSDEQKLFLQKAERSNDRQLQIIDDLLQVARVEAESFSIRFKAIDLKELIGDAISDLEDKLRNKKQTVKYHFPKKDIRALADDDRLRMVFENLIDNASNYSKSGDSIEITLRTAGDKIYVDIQDHGVGISEEDVSLLFQKFSRIPNPLSVEVGGTGVGLYWAQKVVGLHGGDITVRSALGKGSTFTVMIPESPLAEEEVDQPVTIRR